MHLHPRDSQGYAISPALIIFLVVLGAGFLVCCGFAIMRFYSGDIDHLGWTKRSVAQDEYMRDVRERTLEKMRRKGRYWSHAADASRGDARMGGSGRDEGRREYREHYREHYREEDVVDAHAHAPVDPRLV